MKRIRLQVVVLPWDDRTSPTNGSPRAQEKLQPWLQVCRDEMTLQELAEQISDKFANIYAGRGQVTPPSRDAPSTLNIRHLESDFGDILDLTDTVGDVFDDRAPQGESRTSIVKVSRYPPDPGERIVSLREGSLMPESTARPKKRPLELERQLQVHPWPAIPSTGTWRSPTERSNKRQKVRESHQAIGRNLDAAQPSNAGRFQQNRAVSELSIVTNSAPRMQESRTDDSQKHMNAYDAPNPLEERMSQLHPDIEVPDSPTGRAPFVARAVDQSPESESPHLRQSVYDTPPRERTPSAPTRDEVSKDGSQGSHSIPSSPQEPPILPEHSNSEFQFSSPKAKTGQPPPVVRAAHRVSPPAPGVTPPSNIRGAPSERRSTHEDVFDPIETDSDSFLDRQQMHLSERLRINRTPKTLQPEPVTEKRSRETSNKPRSSTSSLTETSQASRLLLQGNAVGPPQAQPAPPSTCTSISDSHATSPPLVNNKQQHYSLNQNLIPAEALQDPPRVNIPAAIVNDSASSRALGKESGLTLLNKARANDVIDVGEHTLGVDAQKKPGKASSDHAFHTPADLERIEGKLPSANHLASKRLSREKVQREEELTRQGEQMMTAANGAKQLELERLIQVSAPRQLSLELNSAKKESTAKPGTTQYRPRTPAQKERRKELAANRRQKSKKEKADEGHGGTPTSSNSQPSLSSQHSKATKPVDASLSVIYSQTNAGLSSSPAPAGLTSKYPRSAMRASGTRSAVPRSVSFDASSTKYSGQGIGSEGRSDLDSTHSQVSSTSQSIENIDEVTVHNTQQRDSNDLAPLVHTQSNKITQSIQTQKRMIQSRLSVTKDRKLEGRSRDLSSSSPNLNSECVVVSSDSDRQDSVSCHSDGERNELSKSSRAESRTANKVTSPAQAPKTPVQHEHPKLATTLDPQLPQRGTRNATPRYSQAIASFGHSLSNISPHQSRSRSPADALSRSVSLNIDSRARRQESEVSDRSAVLDSESIESRSRTTHSNDDLASSSDESIQSPGPRALETGLIEPQQAQGSIPVREKTVISADPKDSSSHLHENLVSLERQQKKTNKSSIVASSLKSGLLSNSIPPKRKEESVSNSDLQNSSPQQHSKNSIAGSVKRDPKSNSAGSSKLKYSKISDMTRGVVADSPDPTVTNQNSRPKMQNVTPDAETSSSSSDEASSKPSGQGLCMAKRLQKYANRAAHGTRE